MINIYLFLGYKCNGNDIFLRLQEICVLGLHPLFFCSTLGKRANDNWDEENQY
jgi:hypothetical protein